MKRIFQIIMFALVFIVVYLGAHFFVLSEYFSLLNIAKGTDFYALLILFSASFIIGMILERKMPNIITKWIYTVSSIWMGVLFISFCTFVFYDIVNIFLRISDGVSAPYLIGFIAFVSAYSLWNGQQIRVKKIKLHIPGLKRKMHFVQLTDLHIGTIRSSSFLSKIVSITNSLKPEAVFITGDLFDGSAPLTKEIIAPVDEIKSKAFFTIGNHEIYDGLAGVMRIVKTTKLKILRNEKTNFKGIEIIGVDFSEDKKYLDKVLPNMNLKRKGPKILLYHPPADLKYIEDNGIALQLSGHTHAGQIFPFNLFVRLAFPYVSGLYRKGESQIYISPGTGTWGPPMRLGSRSEITDIELLPK